MRTNRFGDALVFEARRLQQEHERTRAAIHDGHFGRAHFDVCVVDAEAGERRQQVLDRGDARVAIEESGAELGVADVVRGGADVHGRIEIGTPENDARVGRRGPQRHQHLLTGVQTDALGADGIFESALSEHLLASPVTINRCTGSATLGDGERSRHRDRTCVRTLGGTETQKGALP